MTDDTDVDLVSLGDLESRPHAVLFDGEPRTIRLALAAGESVAPHQHPGREIVLHLVEGRLSVTLGSDEYELEAGDVVRFDGSQDVSPQAVDASTALIVMAERGD